MIIDLILDRQLNEAGYKPKQFYDSVMRYYDLFPNIVEPIANTLDIGTEEEIKKALCKYVIENDYNEEICTYIESVSWLQENKGNTNGLHKKCNTRNIQYTIENGSYKYYCHTCHKYIDTLQIQN